MILVIRMALSILILQAKVNCNSRKAPPSIYSSRVSTEEWISSCAVVEEDVPVCRDPEDTVDIWTSTITTQTPYPYNGFDTAIWDSGVPGGRDVEQGRRGSSWFWRWLNGPRRKHVEEKTTILRDTSSWPKTIVTYLVKGCSPTKVPFNLSPCSAYDEQMTPNRISTTRVIHYLPPTDKLTPGDLQHPNYDLRVY